MHAHGHRHSIFCVLPPYMLEELAKSGGAEHRELALQTLALDTSLRSERTTQQALLLGAPRTGTAAAAAPHRNRRVYSADHGTSLPGTPKRAEGQAATGDAAVDEAYDGFGATFDLYWDVYRRNSIDDAGMELDASVHYGSAYDNAFWNGSQMVFGDGDDTYFNRFTIAVDVIGHELTHGVTAHQANLVYQGQSGALNESVSDVFGSLVRQYALRQTATQADWLIGKGLFTSSVNGVALRSMKAPGTAYDDRVLGKDPQPDHMSRYVTTSADNGGVHINSGIPNRAFYLLAVALGGHAWEKAGLIWYRTLCDARLHANAQFQDFANLTADNAARLLGATERQAVVDAWEQVGVHVRVGVTKISGPWVLHYSWGPTNAYAHANLVFHANGTFGGAASGRWVQQNGRLLLRFDAGPARYAGTVDGNVGSGAMTTFAGLDGCWYLSKQGVVGLVPSAAPAQGAADIAGNEPAPEEVPDGRVRERERTRTTR